MVFSFLVLLALYTPQSSAEPAMSAGISRPCFRLDPGGFALDVDLELPGKGIQCPLRPFGLRKTISGEPGGLEHPAGSYIAVGDEIWQDDARGIFVPTHRRSLAGVFQGSEPVRTSNREGECRNSGCAASRPQTGSSRPTRLRICWVSPDFSTGDRRVFPGERQRVAIARALLSAPSAAHGRTLAALDLKRKREILPYLQRLHAQLSIPVVYVSHAPGKLRASPITWFSSMAPGRRQRPLGETLARIDPGGVFPTMLASPRYRARQP